MEHKTKIFHDDIMSMDQYSALRSARRKNMTGIKKNRRVHVGPDATFYFESYETIWHQIHEMLFIERGGQDQIADELSAYNPLIPNGAELVATLMFEVEDEVRRTTFLAGLGGVEETVILTVDGIDVMGVPEQDLDRTTADGKASAVQFIHFAFEADQIAAFRSPTARIILSINHPAYGHMASLSEPVRAALANDFG